MAENPLLPDDELRRLYRLLQQADRAGRKSPATATFESFPAANTAALYTACAMQLQGTDALVLSSLLNASKGLAKLWSEHAPTIATVPAGISPLLAGASIASAQQARSTDSLVLTLVEANAPDSAWQSALQWAQEQTLPLITAFMDHNGPDSMQRSSKTASVPGWTAIDRICRQLKLPILTVDGQDAVASYRVMQESALRARAGGGPAVLWAVLPSLGQAVEQTPLAHLASYMKVRRIGLR